MVEIKPNVTSCNDNQELMLSLMNFSKYGALSQIMVMQALEHYTQEIIRDEEEILKKVEEDKKDGKRAFVNMESWIGVAKEIKEKSDKFYNRYNLKK